MSGLLWKLNRLRVMSFSEILCRLARSVTIKIEQFMLERGWQPQPLKVVSPLVNLFGEDALLVDSFNESFHQNIEHLHNNIDGYIAFFGHEPLSIGHPVNWHSDPVTGITAPLVFGKTLNYRDDAVVGNVKFIWELGRHQHLVPLAVAYITTGDTKYRDVVITQITSWIDANPYGKGIHWCSALEASLRIISWSLIHSLLVLRDGGQGLFASVDKHELGTSIYQHMYFVRHFLSRHSSANNHLIGEITGLWVGCSVFDLGPEGQGWADFAHTELEIQAGLQVYDDGVNKEQATYYHMWVLEYLLFASMTGIRAGKSFSAEFDDRLYAMLSFLKDMSPDDGEPPQIGDADDGFVARFEPVWPEYPYKEMIAAAESALGLSQSVNNQKAFWYQAISGTEKRPAQTTQPWKRHYPTAYSKGGYAILGDTDCHLVMDAGNLGYLGIAAHGHADALSICLALEGEWWLVDPGTYAYHSDQKWRNYFRGTRSHNTVIVGDMDQSTIAGPFMWTQKASAKLLYVKEEQGLQSAAGEHDGYRRLGVHHRRTVSFNSQEREIKLIDVLTGGENTKVAIYFHFAPDIQLTCEENTGNWIASRENSSRRLVFILDNVWEVEVFMGSENPILGWYSPALEEKIASFSLCGKANYSDTISSTIKVLLE